MSERAMHSRQTDRHPAPNEKKPNHTRTLKNDGGRKKSSGNRSVSPICGAYDFDGE